ncbi:hypothetical protein [Actinokineospora globicatena]|uniref:hypothetical protein n=1 Tax=Actinokineospora globicatena TaxID=103729 RepID=UPI0020A4D738|nr:hypothetical protein [Actinokineospora globicatena]MCP2301090.1 hypothetical protein [Actinokineospora globicatena]GLW77274.1 hypothetical protein Aglo01_17560 [Actinokineospora globicatena]GLW84108.1 hypothetical protein Aglo02_17480 [Actinokineospora globicatena]
MNPIDRIRHRVRALARREAAAAAAEVRTDLDLLRTELTPKLDDLTHSVTRLTESLDWLGSEHRRIAPQVAAVESRLATVEHPIPGVRTSDDPTVNAMAALVGEIREEHARVRARLSLISRYEERLSRLENPD